MKISKINDVKTQFKELQYLFFHISPTSKYKTFYSESGNNTTHPQAISLFSDLVFIYHCMKCKCHKLYLLTYISVCFTYHAFSL